MKLPNQDSAVIAQAKIADYLLSPTHSGGGSKAEFFAQFGFSQEHWEVLAEALRQHAIENDVVKVEESPFGMRYVIEGPITTPIGRTPSVRAVWFIDAGQDYPRLVTAYPLKPKEGEDDQGT